MKMECLNNYLKTSGSLLRVLGDADLTVVQNSIKAIESLPSPVSCNNIEALRSRIPPPSDEITKKKVEALREKLIEVVSLNRIGKYQKGLELVRKLKIDAKKVDYKLVQAEVLYELGDLLDRIGEYQKAENCSL